MEQQQQHTDNNSSSSLKSLKESLTCLQTNTSKMVARLQKFEKRLDIIDDKMLPIREKNKSYMAAKENIALTLVEVGKTYEYFRITAETAGILMGGLHYVPAQGDGSPAYSNYEEYWKAIAKLYRAKQFFEANRSIKATNKIRDINDLIRAAEKACNDEITRILTSTGLTIEVIGDEYKVINPLTDEDAENIKSICNCMELYGYTSYLETFSSVRTHLIKEYLKTLETKFETDWYSIYCNVSIDPKDIGLVGLTASNKDKLFSGKNIMPYVRGKNPFKLYYDVAQLIIRGELQLWASTLPLLDSVSSSSSSSSSSSMSSSDGQSNNKSVLVFVNICDVIIREMQRLLAPFLTPEQQEVRPRSQGGKTSKGGEAEAMQRNDEILKQTNLILLRFDILDIFNSKYDEFRDYCRPDVRHETTASYSLQVMRNNIVIALVENINQVMEVSCGAISIEQFQSFIVSHKDDSTFPNITDLDPITSGIVHCCEELVSSSNVFRVFTELADSLGKPVEENCSNVYSFIVSLIENLITYLKRKAECFGAITRLKPVVMKIASDQHSLFEADEKYSEYQLLSTYEHLFLINNLFLLSSFLKENQREPKSNLAGQSTTQRSKSALLQSFYKQFSTFSSNITIWLNESEEMFFGVIEKAVGMAKSDLDHLKADITNDKSGKNRVLKSKFSVFNCGIDSFMSMQGVLCVASPMLREPLGERMAAYLLMRYTEFHGTYSKTNFSKKHQKDYVKYAPSEVATQLRGFFGK